MNNTYILAGLAVVFLVLYLWRRSTRLKKER